MIDFPTPTFIGQKFNSGTGAVYVWDGVAWNLDPTSALFGPDFVQGLTAAPNATTPTTQIDIKPGSANRGLLFVQAPTLLTKKLDANFAVGTGQGGLDTGAKAASKSYFAHEIRRQSDGLADTLFSLSPDTPTLPAGWDRVQRIFAFKTDSSGNIVPFLQSANRMSIASIIEVSSSAGFSTALRVLNNVPLGIPVRARLAVAINGGATSTVQMFVYGATKATSMGTDLYGYVTTTASGFNYGQIGPSDVETNAAGQIQVGLGIPGGTGLGYLYNYGWDDFTVPRIGA